MKLIPLEVVPEWMCVGDYIGIYNGKSLLLYCLPSTKVGMFCPDRDSSLYDRVYEYNHRPWWKRLLHLINPFG